MRIAFFNSHNIWVAHTQTELEIMQRHLDQGDEIVQLICNADLPACDVNHNHDVNRCLECIGKRKHAIGLLSSKVRQEPMSGYLPKSKAGAIPYFNTIEELQDYYYNNFDVGYATCSSVVSSLRDPRPNMQEQQRLVRRYLLSAIGIYRAILNFIEKEKPDKFYVFNGRFAQVKAVLRACQKKEIDCYIHERGSNKDRFYLVKNATPHELNYVKGKMDEMWLEADKGEAAEEAREYYNQRVKGEDQHWKSFTGMQKKGVLPENWDPQKRNIAIFPSSEDEFVSIARDFKNRIYPNQFEGIKQIVDSMHPEADLHFYIRLHPNMAGTTNKSSQAYFNFQAKNATLILPDSSISSYSLMAASDKVITFGSTMGVEATYWGKPSILMGVMFYEDLDCVYTPQSHTELCELLKSKLEPKSKENTYPYINYLKNFGTDFKYYEAEDLFNGTFKGVKVVPKLPWQLRLLALILSAPPVIWFKKYYNYLHRTLIERNYF